VLSWVIEMISTLSLLLLSSESIADWLPTVVEGSDCKLEAVLGMDVFSWFMVMVCLDFIDEWMNKIMKKSRYIRAICI